MKLLQSSNISLTVFLASMTSKSHRNVRYLKWCIEEDLKTISDWFKVNKLTLNFDKTVYVFFGNSRNESKPVLEIDNTTLKPVAIAKF